MKIIVRTIGLEAHPSLPAFGSSLHSQVRRRYPLPPNPRGYHFIPNILVKIGVSIS